MNYRFYYSPLCQKHLVAKGHPECPERLERVTEVIRQHENLQQWQWHTPSEVDVKWFLYAHPQQYVDDIFSQVPDQGLVYIDGDTCLSAGSGKAVCLAGGGLKNSLDWLMKEQEGIAFCANRPPGHHAESSQAMGFCLFGFVANLALYAQQNYNLKKIAILDFDVHHGNGTEDILQSSQDILFASSYQEAIFPGGTTPCEHETRQIIPLRSQIASEEFRTIWQTKIFNQISSFLPDLIIVSAGFDAHINDPLASCSLQDDDYFWLGHEIKKQAQSAGKKVIANLEGGYHIPSLARSVSRFLEGLQS